MGAVEEYKARNAEREARRAEKQKPPEKTGWWFSQPVPIDRFTGWLVAWTALLVTATIANVIIINHTDEKVGKQAEIAHRQLDVMKAQTRPWLKGAFNLVKLSKSAEGALYADIDVRFINVGNYPAPVVFVSGAVIPHPGQQWQVQQKWYCDNAASSWGNILKNPTNNALPNEWSPWQRQNAVVWPPQIAQWHSRIVAENGGKLSGAPDRIALVFIGCIVYSATDPNEVHQTGFMLDFANGTLPSGPPKTATFDISGKEAREYDLSDISLIQGFQGSFGN
ncbi:hypothetical protein IVA88_20725 [Bradyrhizobium sp. 149]|uniref:hypothetical protein n=1 Tax=Bradyrhizobium sp. 149 TaxID=2782624 RepID=UPI001FF89A60|nr:hypothetical protein [Bradyrhizobium sp. 149]MCK1653846.1 hypothetical protein [Bradyrhizobium sp. 149]